MVCPKHLLGSKNLYKNQPNFNNLPENHVTIHYTAFLDADGKKNKHKLIPTGIPDALQMIMHLKLFIPLSMLTTASLSCIHFSNNLKFKNIPFNNMAGKYTLDKGHFPP